MMIGRLFKLWVAEHLKRIPAVRIAIYGSLFLFFTPGVAHAYIDPGTGSYLLQLAVAGLLDAAFTISIYWRKLKSSLRNIFHGRKFKK